MEVKNNSCVAQTSALAADEILGLVRRYRLMTASCMRALRPQHFEGNDVAKKSLERLLERGRIRKAPLYLDQYYYYLPQNSADSGLSETAKIRNLAMLSLCASPSHQRMRLNHEDFNKYFPDAVRHGIPMNYYVQASRGAAKLGFMRVDVGGRGRWDRIVAKALEDARKHQFDPAMKNFREQSAIEIRIITSLQQKADRIQQLLSEDKHISPIPIYTTVIPELLHLIAPLPIAATPG